MLVVLATWGLQAINLDDPVGAVPVHLVCGVWGTLAVGLFSAEVSVSSQLVGIGATAVLCLSSSIVVFVGIDQIWGLRVSAEEEMEGLDVGEHGINAYAIDVLDHREGDAKRHLPHSDPAAFGATDGDHACDGTQYRRSGLPQPLSNALPLLEHTHASHSPARSTNLTI